MSEPELTVEDRLLRLERAVGDLAQTVSRTAGARTFATCPELVEFWLAHGAPESQKMEWASARRQDALHGR